MVPVAPAQPERALGVLHDVAATEPEPLTSPLGFYQDLRLALIDQRSSERYQPLRELFVHEPELGASPALNKCGSILVLPPRPF